MTSDDNVWVFDGDISIGKTIGLEGGWLDSYRNQRYRILIGRFYSELLIPVIVVGITDTIFTEISHEPKAAGKIFVIELKPSFVIILKVVVMSQYCQCKIHTKLQLVL